MRYFLPAIVVLSFLTGCATTTQTTGVIPSGFLQDYSQLRPGQKGEAQLRYIDPNADFAEYDKILMDPVAVYAAEEDSNLSRLPKDQLQNIVDYFDAVVREQLKGDYTFVNKVEPGTMRLRIAITEAKGAIVPLTVTSTILPIGRAVSAVSKLTTGVSAGAAMAGIEMELLDAQTGRRLMACVDERAGGRRTALKKWEGVQKAYDYWAKTLKVRLAELRDKG